MAGELRSRFSVFADPAFRTSDFRSLGANTVCHAASLGADYILIGWLALKAEGSTAWVGTAFALYFLPMLLLGVPAGAVADRLNRRRLLRNLEWVAGLTLVVFALVIGAGHNSIAVIFCLTLVLGSLRAVRAPVWLAYTYDIVGAQRVVSALAATNFASRTGSIAGAAICGFSTEFLGPAYALGLMSLAHAFAWLCLPAGSSSPSRTTTATKAQPLLQNLRDYIAVVRGNRLALALILSTACIEIFGTSFYTALPEFADVRLAVGADGLGWMHVILSTGGLLAALVVFVMPELRRGYTAWYVVIIGLGLSVFALGAADTFLSAAIALAMVSAMVTVWDVLTQSHMQLSVADEFRGRAMGAWIFAIGAAPFGHLEMGLLVAALGLELGLYLNGLGVLIVIGTTLLLTPELRRR